MLDRKTATITDVLSKLCDLSVIQMGEINRLNEFRQRPIHEWTLENLSTFNHLCLKYAKELGLENQR